MASELIVQTLKGPTSGANANKVIVPSGQTLDASAGGFTTPAGHVIQVVTGNTSTTGTTTSTSYSSTNSTATITPTSTSSTILAYFTGFALLHATSAEGQFAIYRDSTDLTSSQWSFGQGESVALYAPLTFHTQDSPSSTSALTYTLQYRVNVSGETLLWYRDQRVTLMEIAG